MNNSCDVIGPVSRRPALIMDSTLCVLIKSCELVMGSISNLHSYTSSELSGAGMQLHLLSRSLSDQIHQSKL